MPDQGWSSALMAASGVAVSGAAKDDATLALVREAQQAALPPSRALELSRSREPDVREAIAARPDCPLGIQAALLHDRRASVRVALAANSAMFGAVARELAQDRDASVLKALARSEATPRDVLEQLARHRRPEVAHLARRALEGTILAPRPAVPELEDGAERRVRAADDDTSPVVRREGRTYAPRPSVRGAAPGPTRWA